VIVPDVSVVLSALLNAGPARKLLSEEYLCVPDLVDGGVAEGLRLAVADTRLTAAAASAALDTWCRLGVHRNPSHVLLGRAWEFQQLDTTTGACVALAEALDCSLATSDRRIAAIEGLNCPVLVLAQ